MKQFDNPISEELLTRYLLNETTEQENLLIKKALEQDETLRRELQSLKNVLDMVEMTRIDTNAAWKAFSTKMTSSSVKIKMKPRHTMFSLRKLTIAASVAIIIGVSSWFGIQAYMSQELVKVAQNETLVFELRDGSTVSLNRESELTYPRRFAKNDRTVYLKGEAYFEVTPEADKPFIIETTDMTVTVLGTSFFVRAIPWEFPEVLVETGTVQCTYKPTGETIVLTAGETATFGQNEAAPRKASVSDMNMNAWKTFNLRFENERLDNIVYMVDRAYGTHIELEGPISDCRLTVNFNNLNIDGVLNVLQSILDIKYTKSRDKIILKGQGC